MPRPSQKLRDLLAGPDVIQAPGVFVPILARLVERLGFPAVYVSGAGLSNGVLGLPDVGRLSMTEVACMAGRIAAATTLPVICDADTGYGGPALIRRAVAEFIKQGVAGIHIEDQVANKKCGHLPGKELVSTAEMVERLRSAVDGRASDPDFVLIARTDARADEGLEAAIARARAYLEAGADVIFAEALQSKDEFAKFTAAVNAPILANITEFGKTPLLTLSELRECGVKIAIYPQTCLRIMLKSAETVLSAIKESGTQSALLDQMQTRKELYELLDYNGWKETGVRSK